MTPMPRRAAALAALVLVPLAMLAPSARAAEFHTSQSMEIEGVSRPAQQWQEMRQIQAGERHNAELVDSLVAPGLRIDAHSVGWSSAGYGWLSSYSASAIRLNAADGGRGVQITGSSQALLTDTFVISRPTCQDGTVGTMWFSVLLQGDRRLDGGFAAGTSPDALRMSGGGYTANVSVQAEGVPVVGDPAYPQPGNTWSSLYDYQLDVNGTVQQQGDQDGADLGFMSVSFVFGQPIHLQMGLTTYLHTVVASNEPGEPVNGWASSLVDFGHSLSWGGIAGLWDENGQAVTGYTALNADGISFAQALAAPVPEPRTWALLALGLALLIPLARRATR